MRRHKITRRTFTKQTLATGLTAVGGAGLLAELSAAEDKPPSGVRRPLNVLLLLADDQGRDLSCMGTKGITTPAVDGLAASGVLFRSAFSSCASCSPSRGSILTGMHIHSNGFWRNVFAPHLGQDAKAFSREAAPTDTVGVREEIPTLVEVLNAAGYLTGITQKFHLNPAWKFPFRVRKPCDVTPAAHGKVAAEFFQQAADKPFFLMANIGNTHRPFPQNIVDIGRPRVDPDAIDLPDFLADVPEMRKDYAEYLDTVQCADACAGAVLKALRESGRADNTLIIFTSDHGIAYHRAKATVYPAGVNIPMVVSGPGLPAGSVIDHPVSLIDLMPTILDFVGIATPKTVQGTNLRGVLEGKTDKPPHELVFCEHQSHGPHPCDYYPSRAVTDGRMWYIRNLTPERRYQLPDDMTDSEPWQNRAYGATLAARERCPLQYELLQTTYHRPAEELHDLRTDPWAMHNLASDKRYRPQLAKLRVAVERWRTETGDTPDEKKISVKSQRMPEGGLRHVALLQAPWMKDEIVLRFPETLRTDTLDFIDHQRDDMPPRVPSAPLARIWRQEQGGALSFEWKYDNQTVGGRLMPGYTGVDLEFWLENRRSTAVPVALQFCPILRDTMFDDRSLDRTWIHVGGRWRKMAETDRGAGKRSLCHYPVKGGPTLNPPLPWGASKDVVDAPVVAVTSEDGRHIFAIAWPRPHSILSNSDIPCVHVDPSPPMCPPGERVSIHGKVYLLAGVLDGVLALVHRDFPAGG